MKRGAAYLRRLGLLLTAKAKTCRRGTLVGTAARDRWLLYGPRRRVGSVEEKESEKALMRGWSMAWKAISISCWGRRRKALDLHLEAKKQHKRNDKGQTNFNFRWRRSLYSSTTNKIVPWISRFHYITMSSVKSLPRSYAIYRLLDFGLTPEAQI